MRLPSGDQTALPVLLLPEVICVMFLPLTSTVYRSQLPFWLPRYPSRRPLGDQLGKMASVVKDVTWNSLPVEVLSKYRFQEPLRLLWNTIQFKSGDQKGLISLCGLEVNWRSTPVLMSRRNTSQ